MSARGHGTRKRFASTLVVLVVLVAAVAIGLGLRVLLEHRSRGGSPNAGTGAVTTTSPGGSSTTLPVDIIPGRDQTLVTGTISSLSADNAIGPSLRPPFTITIPSRGQGNADFTGVVVGGQNVEIFWYGGQPLPISGTGELAVDGGAVTVDASGITWMLDGAPRSLTTGRFNLGAPVAVGAQGLATPRANVAFDAGDRSTVQTSGHAQVHLAPAVVHLSGPGSVTLHGDLQAQTATGTRRVPAVVFGPGSYAVDLTPTAAGDAIHATLQGPVSFG